MEHERDAYGGLMVSAFNSRLSGPGSFPGWGHLCCTFLGQTFYSHGSSLHPDV